MNQQNLAYLFSYGTLQHEAVQLSSFGRRLDGAPDAMPGYRQSLVEITDPAVLATSGARFHPIMEPSPNPADEVAGTVFQVTPAELAATDAYEVSDPGVGAPEIRPRSLGLCPRDSGRGFVRGWH
jgi:hypothetical protein